MGTSSWLFSVWLRPPTPPLRPRLTPTFCTEATAVWDTLDTSDTEVSMEATDTSDTLPLPWLEATLPTLLPPPCTSEVLPPLLSPIAGGYAGAGRYVANSAGVVHVAKREAEA